MPKFLMLILLPVFSNCISKEKKASSKIRNSNPPGKVQIQRSGKEVVSELEKLDHFKLAEPSDIEEVKAAFEDSYPIMI